MTDIEKYYHQLCQEVTSRQLANEEGDTQEQTFTRLFLDLLSEAGETENTSVAYDEKDFGTKKTHKINGYAISDNYETVDLFITIYRPEEESPVIYKKDIDQAVTRITNFFRKATYNNYEEDVAESSPIFEFAHTLGSYQELKDNLVRVNAFILTNGEYKGEIPQSTSLNGNKIFYRILDINYLFQISEASHVPIEIDFDEEKAVVPCLPASTDNEEYQAYVAIIPGTCLANLYERFGSRLLEQNVRSFLQFNGKINKGIRETIKTEPHMFFAYNNGLAATADHIELDESGHFISKINNLQIVNGGQTTASIYYTQKKDKADISSIYVQMKISVIKKQEQFSEIVSRISRYANTQNKVNDADFTANNQALSNSKNYPDTFLLLCPPTALCRRTGSSSEPVDNTKHSGRRKASPSPVRTPSTKNTPRGRSSQRQILPSISTPTRKSTKARNSLSVLILWRVVTKRTTHASSTTTFLRISRRSITCTLRTP